MRGVVLAASAIVVAGLWLPGRAAEPVAAQSAAEDAITFEQYREWRLHFIERRQTQLAMQLSAANLPDRQKSRLEQVKAYYDWFAGLPEADRDRRFRERFDQIDANHDGKIDAAERTVWRQKQRAFYSRNAAARRQPGEPEPETH
jgi:hypothetical protein